MPRTTGRPRCRWCDASRSLPRGSAASSSRGQRLSMRPECQEIHVYTWYASLVVSPNRIGDIGRWIAIRPIIFFPFVIGTGSCVDEDRDVKGLLIRERPGCVKRHVAIDEFGGGAHARHTSADVVRLRSPDGRRPWRAFASRSVTLGARDREHTRAAGRVGSKRRPLLQATAG